MNKTPSVIGLNADCVIVDLYDTDGLVVAKLIDPELNARAREECKQIAIKRMRDLRKKK